MHADGNGVGRGRRGIAVGGRRAVHAAAADYRSGSSRRRIWRPAVAISEARRRHRRALPGFSCRRRAAGDALVLLHGGGMSLESWTPRIARLRGTRRIVAIDLPGHGLTGVTDENGYSVEAMAAFVKTVIDALGLQGGLVV